jgi:hypothetical protein
MVVRSTAPGPTGGEASRCGPRRLETNRRAPRRQDRLQWAHGDRVLQTPCATAVGPLRLKTALKIIEINRKKIIFSALTSHSEAFFGTLRIPWDLNPQREASLASTLRNHMSPFGFFSPHIIPSQV